MDVILSIVITLFILLALLGIGQACLGVLKVIGTLWYMEIAIGLSILQLSYLLCSILLTPIIAFYILFILCFPFCIYALSRLHWRTPTWKELYAGMFFLLISIPFLARLISPPTSPDGLSAYLPNIEWVFLYGPAFNPYLTEYTTMPLGAERLMSLAFGMGGFQAVRFLDSSFTFFILIVLFQQLKDRVSIEVAVFATLSVILIPGTLIWTFGTGKVDTISTFLYLAGFLTLVQGTTNKMNILGLIILCSTFNIKYTNWILLCLPITIALIFYIFHSKSKWSFLAVFIPIFFLSISGIRNLIHTNNALAPLIQIQEQTQFIVRHGDLPSILYDLPVDLSIASLLAIAYHLATSFLGWHIVGVVALFYLMAAQLISVKEYMHWLIFLVSSSLLWLIVLGNSPQPMRFYWGNVLIIVIVLAMTIFKGPLKGLLNFRFKNYVFFTVSAIMVICVLYLKGGYILDYKDYLERDNTADWYESKEKFNYAITLDVVDSEIDKRKIYFKMPLALGLLSVQDYNGIPTDFERYGQDDLQNPVNYDYVLCLEQHAIKYPLYKTVKFKRGNYLLLVKE